MNKRTEKVEILPLTGIHIGTGNVLGPMEYTLLKDREGKIKMYRFAIDSVIQQLSGDKKNALIEVIDKDDLKVVRKIIAANIKSSAVLYSLVVSKQVQKLFSEKIDDINNQMLVNEMYRSSDAWQPVIPGSSLKGSIRTAFFSVLARGKQERLRNMKFSGRTDKDLQQAIFGHRDAKNDPFRSIIVRDCPIQGKENQLVTQLHIWKKSEGFQGQQITAEQIRGNIIEGDAYGKTEIIKDESLQAAKKSDNRWQPLPLAIDTAMIIEFCNRFYKDVFDNEYNRFYLACEDPEIKSVADQLKRVINDIDESHECLLRVGRYSQVESVTIEGLRRPRAPRGWGKTRTLSFFNDLYFPLGWIRLRFPDMENKKREK